MKITSQIATTDNYLLNVAALILGNRAAVMCWREHEDSELADAAHLKVTEAVAMGKVNIGDFVAKAKELGLTHLGEKYTAFCDEDKGWMIDGKPVLIPLFDCDNVFVKFEEVPNEQAFSEAFDVYGTECIFCTSDQHWFGNRPLSLDDFHYPIFNRGDNANLYNRRVLILGPVNNGSERPYEYTVANSHGRIMTASVDELKHWTEPMSALTTDALRIGHRVSRIDGECLRSGASTYTSAIVVSTDPFVLVSDDTTMKWQETVKASDFERCGYVNRELVEKCRARLYD